MHKIRMMYTVSMKICSKDNCHEPLLARERCRFHYHQDRNRGLFPAPERNRKCSIDGCARKFYGKDLCSMHFQRQRLYGRTWGRVDITDVQRFWEKVRRGDNEDDCWEWLSAICGKGYGKFQSGSKTDNTAAQDMAHRFSYKLHHGPIPDDIQVCHTCDNPPCTNPKHLFLGSVQENAQDMVKKRRWRSGLSAGEYNYHAKLTLAQVEEIRRLYATEHRRQIDLAKQFNVHQSTISGIVLGHTWQYGNMRGTISAKGAYAD